jgi:hypothetical protein
MQTPQTRRHIAQNTAHSTQTIKDTLHNEYDTEGYKSHFASSQPLQPAVMQTALAGNNGCGRGDALEAET